MNRQPPDIDRSRSIDDLLIELAASGKSREEISRRIGGVLSPERVDQRVNEILKAPDWLTRAQQEVALIRLLQVNIVDLQASPSLDSMKLVLAYIREVFAQMQKHGQATERDLNTWNENTGRELGRIVDKALSYMQGALREKVDPDMWEQVKLEAMQAAWHDIQARQVEA